MEKFKYLQFRDPTYPDKSTFKWFEKIIIKILYVFIPKANPDHEQEIEKVAFWKLEYNLDEDSAWREIGFDDKGNILMRLPNDQNFGYWTDNNLKLEDFYNFEPTEITRASFVDDWQR